MTVEEELRKAGWTLRVEEIHMNAYQVTAPDRHGRVRVQAHGRIQIFW
jgi:hypothetical protein